MKSAAHTDPFLVALARFDAVYRWLDAVCAAQNDAEVRHAFDSAHPEVKATHEATDAAVDAVNAALSVTIATKPTTAAGARGLLDLAVREVDSLKPEELATACANAGPFIGAPGAYAALPQASLSPTFQQLRHEREAAHHAAEASAAAVMDGTPNEDAVCEAADDALKAVWKVENRLMATPAAVPADLGLKAAYLAAQLEEFGHLEDRHCRAMVADLLRFFPLATAEEDVAATPSHSRGAADADQPRMQINRLYADWLSARAQMAAAEAGDEDEDENGDREGDLARAIMATPATDARDVFNKIEVLQVYLNPGNEPTLWLDARDEMLLASIRSDLLRLPPGEARPSE